LQAEPRGDWIDNAPTEGRIQGAILASLEQHGVLPGPAKLERLLVTLGLEAETKNERLLAARHERVKKALKRRRQRAKPTP
jgi:hypothetical protein